ncbi:MAG: hypothetical protein KTR22_12270 [Flavobacteriaceae bacterium]|nr:hypothetical protein [Flavobacteriaceae bacterium]
MSFSSLTQLRDFLKGCISGSQFSLSVGKIGAASIDTIIKEYLSDDQTTLVLKNPTAPTISGKLIKFSGTIDSLLGLKPAYVTLEFGLSGTKATMVVGLAPLSPDQPKPVKDWNLGTAYPVWSDLKSPLAALSFKTPVFYFSSVKKPANATRPAIVEGLNFTAGDLEYTGILAIFNNLPGSFKFQNLTGPITNTAEAPFTQIESAPVNAIPISYLNLPFTFSAISKKYTLGGKIPSDPPPITTFLQLESDVKVGKATIPLQMQFTNIGAVISLVAQLSDVSKYALTELESLINKAPIGNYLSEYVNIGNTVGLRDMGIMLSTKPFGLAAVYLDLGTTAPLTVIEDYIVIPDISVNFWVNDPQGSKDITATITGHFNFLNNVPVQIKAVFPQMQFSGGLASNSHLTVANVFSKFLPSVKDIPDITIANLFVSADLKQGLYNFNIDVTSDWKIPIGIAEFQLKEAEVSLQRQKGKKGFEGEIAATALLFDTSNKEIANFNVDWTLPGNFEIKGVFPEINLSTLATTLSGGFLSNSSGLPTILLKDSTVSLTISEESAANYYRVLDTESTTYDFSLSTEIDVAKIGKADLFFEIKKGKSETGFVTGIVVQPDWTPASIWSGLSGVFDILKVKEAGLVLSSIKVDSFNPPNFDALPYKPDTVDPGITFFSELELQGKAFSLIKKLFDSNIDFQLYAFIDPSDLTKSEIKATLPGSKGQGIITFNGLTIDMKPGAGEFSIDASAILRIHEEQLTLIGSGVLHLTPPSAAFSIDLHCWKEPFGIKGLTIVDFGVGVGISEEVTLGLLGSFLVGKTGEDQFKFTVGGEIIDFEAPGAFVFALDDTDPSKPLKVTDLIKQFTSLDLSKIPLLNGLAFKHLDFYVVDDPNGWQAPNGHFYQPGIGLDADVLFYSYELKLFVEINWDKGIIANGSINLPIEILDILTISDATGKKGPSAAIDTTNLTGGTNTGGLLSGQWEAVTGDSDCESGNMERILYTEPFQYPEGAVPAAIGFLPITVFTEDQSNAYFSFSGGLKFLGLTETFSGSATKDGFEVNFHADLAKLFRASFICTYKEGKSFEGSAKGNFDFDMDFPNGLTIDKVPILPPFSVHGPHASLDIGCAINTTDPYLSFDLDFQWGSFHIHPKFKIDAKEVTDLLSNLWEHIKDWINNNLKDFFSDLLGDVAKFVEAIANGVLKLGQDAFFVARALLEHFGQTISEVAKFLYKEIAYGFDEVVNALVKVFKISMEEALRVMAELGEDCALAAGGLLIGDATTEVNRLNK